MKYEVLNYKENKEDVAYIGSSGTQQLITSIEFKLKVTQNGKNVIKPYNIQTYGEFILPTDLQDFIEKEAKKIAKLIK
ncbi:hypothetical protein AB8U03_15605 [Clostridium sp. Mt-5]|uniref:Uncharacterized protein n=1 Tax=Clostridium moutaii TaxID=3240932 RepID=A0ABV4BS62_9CLOT